MSAETHSSHRLFRDGFSLPAVAEQWLRPNLPPQLVSEIIWESMAPFEVPGVNAAQADRRADVVHRMELRDGRVLCIYALIEHQTKPDPLTALRILEHTLLIWQQHIRLRENDGLSALPLPMVIPFVIHPGPGKWTAPPRLRALMDIPESLRAWAENLLPDAGYTLFPLAGKTLAQLAAGPAARALLGALKEQRKPVITETAIRALLAEFFSETRPGVVDALASALWGYFLYHSDLRDREIRAIVTEIIPEPSHPDFMSTAERLIADGVKKGREEGREEGLQKGLQKGLAARIRAYQRLLGQAPTPEDILEAQSIKELEGHVDSLERDLFAQRAPAAPM